MENDAVAEPSKEFKRPPVTAQTHIEQRPRRGPQTIGWGANYYSGYHLNRSRGPQMLRRRGRARLTETGEILLSITGGQLDQASEPVESGDRHALIERASTFGMDSETFGRQIRGATWVTG